MQNPTKATVERSGDLAILRFQGDIMSTSEEAILGTYVKLASGTRRIMLDFTAVPYLNSSGIALIIELLLAVRNAAQVVVCFGLTPHFEKVFRVLGLSKYTSLYPDQASALWALAERR